MKMLVRGLRVRSRPRFPAIAARYACIVANGEPEVPVDIEQYLAWLSASAGEWGRAVDMAGTDTAAAGRYLDRAAARAAARLRMKVEERTGDGPGPAEQVKARLIAFPGCQSPAVGRWPAPDRAGPCHPPAADCP